MIIRRDRKRIYEHAQQRFSGIAVVVLDRRKRERRSKLRPVSVDRRSGLDRRRPLTEADVWLWENGGYYVTHSRERAPGL